MAQSQLEVSQAALYKIGSTSISSLSDTSKEAVVCNARVDICKRALLEMHPWNFAVKRKIVRPTETSYTALADAGATDYFRVTSASHGLASGDRVTITDETAYPTANGTWEIVYVDANNFDLYDSVFAGSGTVTGNWTRAAATNYAYSISKPSDCLRILRINERVYSAEWRVEAGRISTDLSELEIKYIYDVTDYTTMSTMFYECLSLYLAWDICDHLTASDSKKRQAWTDLFGGDGKIGLIQRARFIDATEDSSPVIESNDWILSRNSNALAMPIQ